MVSFCTAIISYFSRSITWNQLVASAFTMRSTAFQKGPTEKFATHTELSTSGSNNYIVKYK